jgi:hypothetical protein
VLSCEFLEKAPVMLIGLIGLIVVVNHWAHEVRDKCMHILGVVISVGDVSGAIGHSFTSKVDVWGLLRYSTTPIPTDEEIAESEVF